MMTVAEAELVRRAAEKGRSASFCAPSQPLSALHSAHSSSDIHMDARAHAAAFVQAQQQASSSPRARLKASQAARRSQSCRVQGSRPPRVRRRESPRGSEVGVELDEDASASFAGAERTGGEASYNPFLRKVPSCGRLVTLTPDGGGSGEDAEDSPVLRRSASARRPRPPTASSPSHSPTPTRVTRPAQKNRSTVKRSSANAGSRRGGAAGAAGAGYLDVKPSGSNECLDPDAYLLRTFSTTNKGQSYNRKESPCNLATPKPASGADGQRGSEGGTWGTLYPPAMTIRLCHTIPSRTYTTHDTFTEGLLLRPNTYPEEREISVKSQSSNHVIRFTSQGRRCEEITEPHLQMIITLKFTE